MRAIIKTFESGAGDCIFLVMKDEMDNSCFHIMMDCNVLTDEIKAYIRDELYKRIDVLIVTHIDSDHANGIIKLMRNPDFADMHGASCAGIPIISSISFFISSGLAFGKSILFSTGNISRLLSKAKYTLAKVCASTPCDESTTSIAPSHAAKLLDTS